MNSPEKLPSISDSEFEISAFTCTYNRIDTLVRTYQSLQQQSVRNFEWIVYDNGSTDNTKEIVEQWQQEADFPIVITGRPDNSGIQRGYNKGIELARGYFWLSLDSDDELVPEAFETLVAIWLSIPEEKRYGFTGVSTNCVDQHGNIVGETFPFDVTDSNSLEIYYRYKVRGEKFGMHRVDVLRQFPFPDVDEHVNPAVVWWAIAKKYQTRFTNDTLRIYYIEEDDRADQLSFHTTLGANSYGRRLNHMHNLNHNIEWFKVDPVQFVKHAGAYTACSMSQGMGLLQALSEIKPLVAKLLVVIALPPAFIFYWLHKTKTKA